MSCGGGFYASCDVDDDCADVAPEGAAGECVAKENDGFCTWQCVEDSDCNGDHDDTYDFLCAPFESNPGMYCFPSCAADSADDSEKCPGGYVCRSTGGGEENRKVCFPEG